jgi:hypothetical protein
MTDETQGGDALDKEREMREHEAEARRRDSDEQSGDTGDSVGGGGGSEAGVAGTQRDSLPGAGAGDPEKEEGEPAPPGSIQRGGPGG